MIFLCKNDYINHQQEALMIIRLFSAQRESISACCFKNNVQRDA